MVKDRSWVLVAAAVFLLRLPFLNQAIQGDDIYYLKGAEHAQIDPLHPASAKYYFLGDLVEMRGFPHPPLNSWILAAPLAALGDVREVPFHFRYIVFSLIAAIAMWSLARRFCDHPLLATFLFLAVPAFVVNGNSFESDLPFLAMWMAAVALFVKSAEENSAWTLWLSAIFAALAGLAAYQSVLLPPILAFYLLLNRSRRIGLWIAILAAPAALAAWQLFELVTRGALPAAMLAGYMAAYKFQAPDAKLRSALALVVHAGWIVSPLIVFFLRGRKIRWIVAALAAIGAAIYDPNPLFWISFAAGIFLLASALRRDFLSAWILIFFLGAAVVFFAGSARYLLPIAAPVAILATRSVPRKILISGFVLQLALSLGLAIVNYQHWDAYRKFAASLHPAARLWINTEWGLAFYLESAGGVAMPKNQILQPGDTVVSSALALPLPVSAPLAPIARQEIRPSIPLRIISLDGRSAYSSAGGRELLPFEISTAPIDRVKAEIVLDRTPRLTFIDPKNTDQILTGLYPDGWMTDQATVLLKRPQNGGVLRADIFIPEKSPARRITLIADSREISAQSFPSPGPCFLTAELGGGPPAVTVTLKVDRTFSVPGDLRKLGVIVTRIGIDSRP